jgi:peptidoglycan hydrolase-like protein with peptidoglycan-binding domain
MKYAVSAVVALALGLGLAAGAQAHGTKYMRQSTIQGTDMHAGTSGPVRHASKTNRHKMSHQQVIKMQRKLKAAGLYNGRIDGFMGPRTQTALNRFQQQHRVVAKKGMTKQHFAHKTRQPAAVGVGSSMPNRNKQNQNMNSGSSSNVTPAPSTPPATQNPTAGGNTGTTDQNMNR